MAIERLNIMANRKEHVQIDNLIVDVAMTEDYNWNNSITRYPVEDGYFISDHIQQNPETFSISAFFSNNPLIESPEFDKDWSNRDYLILRKFLEFAGREVPKIPGLQPIPVKKAKRLDIITRFGVMSSMAISNIHVVRSAENDGGLYIDISFDRFEVIENEFTEMTTVKDVGTITNMSDRIQNRNPTGKGDNSNINDNKNRSTLLKKAFDNSKKFWDGL